MIRTWSEMDAEREMWKMEKPLPKISSTETEQLTDLLSSVLLYNPQRRITAASLAKHPWFCRIGKGWRSLVMEIRKNVSLVER